MTTLRIQNIVCPHCNNKMYTIGVMSYTLRNSKVFSDGKIISDHPRPIEQNILICSECYDSFWKEDALFDDEKLEELLDDLPEANNVTDLFPRFDSNSKLKIIDYYSKLLNKGFANSEEREIFLRLSLLRALNDTVRYKNEKISEDLIDIFKSNLLRTIEIYKPWIEEEHLLLIEMYRELGRFEKAKELLKKINWSDDNFSFLQIENAIINKKSTVIKL